jgi:hypothetical protein
VNPDDGPPDGFPPRAASDSSERLPPAVIDDLFKCLASHRRRLLIEYLARTGGPVAIEDVVEYVSRETGGPAETPDRGRQMKVDVALSHVHLPKLVDADVVAVDRETGTVERGERFTVAASLLGAL